MDGIISHYIKTIDDIIIDIVNDFVERMEEKLTQISKIEQIKVAADNSDIIMDNTETHFIDVKIPMMRVRNIVYRIKSNYKDGSYHIIASGNYKIISEKSVGVPVFDIEAYRQKIYDFYKEKIRDFIMTMQSFDNIRGITDDLYYKEEKIDRLLQLEDVECELKKVKTISVSLKKASYTIYVHFRLNNDFLKRLDTDEGKDILYKAIYYYVLRGFFGFHTSYKSD